MVNLFPEAFAAKWGGQEENAGVRELFGEDLAKGPTVEGLLAAMDDAGIATGVLTAGLSDPSEPPQGRLRGRGLHRHRRAAPGRFLVSATVDRAAKPLDNVRRVRELASTRPSCSCG